MNQGSFCLQDLLDHANALALESNPQRVTDLLGVGSQNTRSLDNAIQHELNGNTTGDTDEGSHGRVAVGDTIALQGGGNSVFLAIGPLNNELVLEHDEITFALLVLHEIFKTGAESVEEVACTGLDGLRGEETDPPEALKDTRSFSVVGEGSHRLDLGDQGAVNMGE